MGDGEEERWEMGKGREERWGGENNSGETTYLVDEYIN